jgi:MFS transporter, ACS family, tartrate transporter
LENPGKEELGSLGVSTSPLDFSLADRTRRKIARRILPFTFALYVIAYLDRANVAFAKLPMAADLGFSEAVYGFGAGIFFLGYLLLEIPGGIIVERWSARLWMARILITWGLCSLLVGFIHTPTQFYITRTLLGIAEGGFFPGVVVYLTHWFISRDRAKAMAGFITAAPASLALGSPVSALLLRLDWLGMAGWRWMFVLEALPALLFGFISLYYMTDHPKDAAWLAAEEREWIAAELEKERRQKKPLGHLKLLEGLRQRDVFLLAGTTCFANIGIFAYVLWLPSMIHKASGFSVTLSTVCSALPFVLALISIHLFARSSDRTGKRKLHTLVPLVSAAIFFTLSAVPGQPLPLVLLWLCLTGAVAFSWGVSFWIMPSLIFGEGNAAASVGLINIFSALGSFIGPTVVGFLLAKDFPFSLAVAFLSSCFLIAAVLVSMVCIRREVV